LWQAFYKDIEPIKEKLGGKSMGKHAIIIIKNKENKYLQYYDERWQSYLFLNCKIDGAEDIDIIQKNVEDTLGLKDIKCNYLGMKKHTKFSESAQIEKEYEHYFYKIETTDELDNLTDNYKWFSYDELKNDERIQKVNSDIVGFVKEFDNKENNNVKTEYELRVLEIEPKNIISRLEELGAYKIGDFEQKRYVYNLNPAQDGKWIRLRTNGRNTTLTYKDIVSNTIDGTKEIEVEVSDFEATNELLEKMGYFNKGYQENKRIQYELNNVEIDIDSWPLIPSYLEIEGQSEKEVTDMLKLLNFRGEKVTALNCSDIYKKIYGIDIDKIKILKFNEEIDMER